MCVAGYDARQGNLDGSPTQERTRVAHVLRFNTPASAPLGGVFHAFSRRIRVLEEVVFETSMHREVSVSLRLFHRFAGAIRFRWSPCERHLHADCDGALTRRGERPQRECPLDVRMTRLWPTTLAAAFQN